MIIETGTTDTCKTCGGALTYTGSYWTHGDPEPRHQPVPENHGEGDLRIMGTETDK